MKKLIYKMLGRLGSTLFHRQKFLSEIDLKCSPQVKVSQVMLYNFWRDLIRNKK